MPHIYDKKDADKFNCWNFKRNLLSNPDSADIQISIIYEGHVSLWIPQTGNVKPDELFLATLPKLKPLTYTEPSK